MSQNSYSLKSERGFAGMKADSRFDHVESKIAVESISFGRGVDKVIGSDDSVQLPRKDKATIVFDADFVDSNKINLDINGVAITEVDFDTNQATTMDALVSAIEAHTDVYSANDPDSDSDNRTVVLLAESGKDVIVTNVAVTGGSSQAGSTVTQATAESLYGIALSTSKEQDSDGIVQYSENDPVSVLRQGSALVKTEQAVDSDDDVYVRIKGDGSTTFPGNFRKDSDSGDAVAVTGARFKTSADADGIVEVEINLP